MTPPPPENPVDPPEKGEAPVAVLLASGGMDSTVLMACARRAGWRIQALTAIYGQRHGAEVDAARHQARAWGCDAHDVMELPRLPFSGSALTDASVPVPEGRPAGGGGPQDRVPITYVPARNLVLLSVATALAESRGIGRVMIATNSVDFSGYPDCRPEFTRAFEAAASLGTRSGMRVIAPLERLSKADIVRLGTSLGVDLGRTVSCYDADPDGAACGRCDSCLLRRRGFEQAGVPDATRYAEAGR